MMKNYMDGLSVKVFRTYNASVTLNRLLFEDTESEDVVSHKADYDRANKEVWHPMITILIHVSLLVDLSTL